MSDLLLGFPNDAESIDAGEEAFIIDSRGDIQFDNRGQLRLVEGDEKLRQNVGKILLTQQGKSDADPLYGSTLQGVVGTATNLDTTWTLMKQTIIDALGFLVLTYGDSTNGKEKIGTIETLSVKIDPTAKTTYVVELGLTNEETTDVKVRILV